MKAIWKDSAIQFSASTNYVIEAAGQGVYSGRCDMLPDGSCEVLSNKLCQYYVYQDFPFETGVNVNANACKTFIFKDFSGNTVGSDDYICDWSYEDIVFAHNTLSKPVNGHLDPRMRLMWSTYNDTSYVSEVEEIHPSTGETPSEYYFTFLVADYAAISTGNTTYKLLWDSNYPEIYYRLYYNGNNAIIATGSTDSSGITGITVELPLVADGVSYTFAVYRDADGRSLIERTTFYVNNADKYRGQYLTFRARENGTQFYYKQAGSAGVKTISYSTDSGQTWTLISATSYKRFEMDSGDTIMFKGENDGYYFSDSYRSCFSGRTGSLDIEGNIMSMIYGDDLSSGYTLPQDTGGTFAYLFNNLNVVSAENLVLPATELVDKCYSGMFQGCTALTTPPVRLPAEVLKMSCYYGMFAGCTALTHGPELPSTDMVYGCYCNMFENCYSLVSAPELPAIRFNGKQRDVYAYARMFKGCRSLRVAPDLNSRDCASWSEWSEDYGDRFFDCYSAMFSGCTSLSYVFCMSECGRDNNWLKGVASSGTLVKPASVTGNFFQPSSWTVINI